MTVFFNSTTSSLANLIAFDSTFYSVYHLDKEVNNDNYTIH